jgi:hypothetical protein
MRAKKIRFLLTRLILGDNRAQKKILEKLGTEHFELLMKYVSYRIVESMPEYQKGWLGHELAKAPAELLRDAIKLNANLTEMQKTQIEEIINKTPEHKGSYFA